MRNRLITVRKLKVGAQLTKMRPNMTLPKLCYFGIEKNLSAEDSLAFREFFSSKGKLEFYNFVKKPISNIHCPYTLQYIEENNLH
jgi:hypothetical protein